MVQTLKLKDHADLEWKFHRTKLWISYFDEGSSLPAPFNLIITPKWIAYSFGSAKNVFKWIFFREELPMKTRRATIKVHGFNQNNIKYFWPADFLRGQVSENLNFKLKRFGWGKLLDDQAPVYWDIRTLCVGLCHVSSTRLKRISNWTMWMRTICWRSSRIYPVWG